MLESIRKGQRWLTFIFVASIGLVFVFFFGTGGGLNPQGPTGNAVIQLDDIQLTTSDLDRERRQTESQLRQQLGDAYDEVGADKIVMSRAFGTMLNNVLLASAAEEMGLQVTKAELRRLVQSDPGLLDEQGRFDPELFDQVARQNFGTQRVFIRTVSRQLLAQKFVSLLLSQTAVSDSEIDLLTRYENQEVRIAFVALDAVRMPTDRLLEDNEVETYAAANDETLRAMYNERAEGLAEPEKVRARHILMRADADAPDEIAEAVRARALAAHARVVAGESFYDVAREVSEDSGTADEGGDLGLFARGANDVAIDDTAFALESGGISEVVRSAYGYHVVQVDEKVAAHTPSFDDLRESLARESLEGEIAREFADSTSAQLVQEIADGRSLEDAARDAGLTLERPGALRRRPDGYIPGMGPAEDVMSAAFALAEGQSGSEVYNAGDKRILLQVLERIEPSTSDLIAAREERREQLLRDKQNRIVSDWLDDYRTQLEKDGRLKLDAELALGG